mgnify:CR=1 FL=1
MSEYQYNKVTPEMIEKFKEIAPKRVLVGDESMRISPMMRWQSTEKLDQKF